MYPIHIFIHLSFGFVGFIANAVLIAVIVKSRQNRYLQTYSLLLLNSAVTDLVAGVADGLSMIRLILAPPAILYLYQGICGAWSEGACFFMYSLIIHLAMHSIVLIALSFWYRNTTLSGTTPTALRLQIICLVALVPSFLLHVQFQWASGPREQVIALLTEVYPELNATIIRVGGVVSSSEPHSFLTTTYVCILPFIAYSVIIKLRRQVKQKLAQVTTMSDRTKTMHVALVKALSVHATLPASLCLGVISFLLMASFVGKNVLLESFVMMGVTFPSVFNPIVTLYFVGPFRSTIANLFCNKGKHKITSTSTIKLSKFSTQNQ